MTLPVEMADLPEDVEHAWELSRRYDEHPVYDMLYVTLAERSAYHSSPPTNAWAKLESRGSVTGLDR